MQAWIDRYLEWMQVTHYSKSTVSVRRIDLKLFREWCQTRALQSPQQVTRPILEVYQRHLFYYRQPNGQPLSFNRQAARLIAVKGFFKWLTRQNHILYNPASELDLPRRERRLPKAILNADEMAQLLDVPDTEEPLGLRDRAIMETLYSTGMRRAELVNLDVYDLDEGRKTLLIRQGKGGKDRMVPIGERALSWLVRYRDEVRPSLMTHHQQLALFLTHQGERYAPNGMSYKIRTYLKKSQVPKSGGCHLFRHTMATQMLENGADIRFIQELLGHAKLETTQIYTHVSIAQLQAIHAATHPAAKIKESDSSD